MRFIIFAACNLTTILMYWTLAVPILIVSFKFPLQRSPVWVLDSTHNNNTYSVVPVVVAVTLHVPLHHWTWTYWCQACSHYGNIRC